MNIIERLEFEITNSDSAVHRFNHYTMRTPHFTQVARVDIAVTGCSNQCAFSFFLFILQVKKYGIHTISKADECLPPPFLEYLSISFYVCKVLCIITIVCIFSSFFMKKNFYEKESSSYLWKKKLLKHIFYFITTVTHTHTLYIYIYSYPYTDCFMLSQLFSVARHAGSFKLGLKLYVRLRILPLSR